MGKNREKRQYLIHEESVQIAVPSALPDNSLPRYLTPLRFTPFGYAAPGTQARMRDKEKLEAVRHAIKPFVICP